MNVYVARTLDDAIQFMARTPDARLVAGGTDLLPRINQKLETHGSLCYIPPFPETSGVRTREDGSVFVGASVRLSEAAETMELKQYAAVARAASLVASPQIRNQGTIGGNILQENRCMYFNNHVPWSDVNRCFKWGGKQCFQYKKSPECVALFQSDVAPALMAFQAEAVIRGAAGERRVQVSDLYLTAGRKALAHDEVLVGVILPPPAEGARSTYQRWTIRGSFDFPLLSCALRAVVSGGEIRDCTAVFGAAGVMPRAYQGVAALIGKRAEQWADDEPGLLAGVSRIVAPFRDTRVNAAVRTDMGKQLLSQALRAVCAGGDRE